MMNGPDTFQADIRSACKGDRDAFARLYSIVYKDMYHIALYSLRNQQDACDAVSEAVLDAYSSICKLKDEKAFRSWIMQILSSKIRKKQREYYSSGEELTDESIPTVEFDCERAELKEALDKLDGSSRLILSMAVLEGYTSDEIAEACGVKAGTIRSRLSRIKERLRLELGV